MQMKSMAAVALATSGLITSIAAGDAVEWRVADGGNGHWYGLTENAGTWDQMRLLAAGAAGELVSILTDGENEVVRSLVAASSGSWIGASKSPQQPWRWADGSTWGYTHWCPGEPCCGDGEPYVYMSVGGCWDDHNQTQTLRRGVIEWSSDCNNDGIVDYGQILSGSLADTNANGVPDTCELSVEPFEVVALQPDPAIVSSADVRARIEGSGYPWKIRDRRNGMEFVLVPPGRFVMGSDSSDPESVADEMPAHEVILTNPLYLAKTEVTQGEWFTMTGTQPSYFGNQPNNPVERVSWLDAVGAASMYGYRLPTEAEWEHACRGEVANSRYGPLNEIAWWGNGFGGTSGWGTNPVGTKAANVFGLHDMIGNVWEYCQDYWGQYGAETLMNPTGPASGTDRVGRSGDWYWPAVGNRATYRLSVVPDGVGLASNGVRYAVTPGLTGLYDPSRIQDCNADGIVDYGQILSGSLADTNANGVPDICESTLLVPSQYPTIQAAIDAVPANSQRTVQVAAGTYNESFSLNGKDVLVRGAAKNATILDGTGLITSIAKFTGGEPATAGVESLVFRNGTAGSRLTPKEAFTVGGAIFANTTAAHIKDCRFENCRADFGGAVYQYVGSLAWDNCVFTGNTANAEGGAVLTYNCTGSVRGCSFTANRCGLFGPGSGSAFKSVGSNGDGETIVLDTCTITGNIAGDSGSAVEHYEHTKYHPGVLRVVNTSITGNTSGQPIPHGAAGLRVLGRMQSCVLATGTNICNNTPKNVDGPYFIEGAVTVCGCAADITDDGVVNGGDLGVMLSNWGLASSSGVGDVSHDGVVDGVDLAELLARWGICQ